LKEIIHYLETKDFPHGGLYILRSRKIYLLAVCHPIGVNGVGPHKHNDWLSFELCVGDQPVIIDPGTFCYTGNMEMRSLFRSTAYHNTVVVDGQEQILILNRMFALRNPYGEARALSWETGISQDVLETEHTGYTRLSSPVVHRRCFSLEKEKEHMEITDEFLGKGEHLLEWYFHLDVGLECQLADRMAVVYRDQRALLHITFPDSTEKPYKQSGLVSRSYNYRQEAEVICLKCRKGLENSESYTFQFFPNFDL